MIIESLKELAETLEKQGELKRIPHRLSPCLEIPALTSETTHVHGPALLFTDVEGYNMQVLTNAFGSVERTIFATGFGDIRASGMTLARLIKEDKTVRDIKRHDCIKIIDRAPCRETVLEGSNADLGILPALKCWPQDAGAAFTLPVVFTADPETGILNAGIYRMQLLDSHRAIMHWYPSSGGAAHFKKACRLGRTLQAAVALGPDPSVTIAACMPLPRHVSEVEVAAVLRGKPVKMTPCLHSDMLVPAWSQIVLEGTVEPVHATEGPFATHTGYYSPAEPFPMFRTKCITMQGNAIFPATVPGPPPQEDCFMAQTVLELYIPVIREMFPEITDIYSPPQGIFGRIVFISIKKEHPFQGRKLLNKLLKPGSPVMHKIIWLFDQDTDIRNHDEVLWKMANHLNPAADTVVTETGPSGLDPACFNLPACSRAGLDCTTKLPEEREGRAWPEKVRPSPEAVAKARKVAAELGLLKC